MTVRDNMGFALKLAKTDPGRDRPQGDRGREDPRPRAAPRAQAGEPLRRPAPARGHGPRDRARPEVLPDGRAAVEPRREAARADAHRGRADPAPARDHDGLRDARPDRGHDARRPRRGHARGAHPAGRRARQALRRPDQPVRRRLHRLAVDELPARHGSRATSSSCRSATARRAGAPARRAEERRRQGAREVIVGVRPEHFEDALIEADRPGLMKFKAKVDVVESMGSELYAYFDVETEGEVQSEELADLAKDAGLEDLPHRRRPARGRAAGLGAPRPAPGGEIELVLDTTEIKLFDPDGGRSLTYAAASNGAGAKAASASSSA